MTQESDFDGKAIGRIYDEQAELYARFADNSYTWDYIEKPAFDKYLPDLFTPDTQVLDLGCGEGRVIRHLISKGIRVQNVVGVDVSSKLIEIAQRSTPEAKYLHGSLDEVQLPQGSFDLITANMVFHHMTNSELETTLERIYELLKPEGQLFFVDTDPDHNDEGIDPANLNKWLMQQTPWGTEIPYFNRHPRDFFNLLDLHGFDYVSGWLLKVSDDGKQNPEKFQFYSSHPSRIAGRFKSVAQSVKDIRMSGETIPNLIKA